MSDMDCPLTMSSLMFAAAAGMSHTLNMESFRTSKRILREQRRRKEQKEQAGGSDEDADDDGVDVE